MEHEYLPLQKNIKANMDSHRTAFFLNTENFISLNQIKCTLNHSARTNTNFTVSLNAGETILMQGLILYFLLSTVNAVFFMLNWCIVAPLFKVCNDIWNGYCLNLRCIDILFCQFIEVKDRKEIFKNTFLNDIFISFTQKWNKEEKNFKMPWL